MTKKIPFNYEIWKANPSVKLVTRDGRDAVVLGENPNVHSYPLIGYAVDYNAYWGKDGSYSGAAIHDLDLFYFVEVEEKVVYQNLYKNESGSYRDTIEEVNKNATKNRLAIAKHILVDGIPDYSRSEIVQRF